MLKEFVTCAMSISSLTSAAIAQDRTLASYPIIEPKLTEENVDMTSGAFIVTSPFALSAPGSANLNFRSIFNGRVMTSSLDYYLLDETYYTISVQDGRQISVRLGGFNKVFKCGDGSECVQIAGQDGTRLIKLSDMKYRVIDRDGVVYDFSDMIKHTLYDISQCSYESKCNYAEYAAHANIAEIKYPSGEILKYNGLSSISSNIGYSLNRHLDIDGYPWVLSNVFGEIGRISSTQENIYGTGYIDPSFRTLIETDWTGRQFRVEMRADPQATCDGQSFNRSNFIPTKTISPQQVETTVTYPALEPVYVRLNAVGMGEPKWGPQGNPMRPVATVTRAGRTWNYTAGRTDPLGHVTKFTTLSRYNPYAYAAWDYPECATDELGAVITSIEDAGGKVTTYDYDSSYRVIRVTMPEGNREEYDYDLRGNILQVRRVSKQGVAKKVFEASFNSTCNNAVICNKPVWVRDALDRQTDYTYDPVHGGVLTETGPADQTGARPQKRYVYSALYSADASGTPIAAGGPIYKVTAVSTCSVATTEHPDSCVGSGAEIIEEYAYAHPHLMRTMVRKRSGDNAVVSTTTFSYDALDRLKVIDGPRADVDDRSYILYDTAGRPAYEIGPDPDGAGPLARAIVRKYYNLDNQEIRLEIGTGMDTDGSDFVWTSARRKTYDAAGLLVKTETVVP